MSSRALCPYCNGHNTFHIAYGYLGNEKKEKHNYIDQEKIGLNYKYRNVKEKKYDFDGERISYHHPNHYCEDCNKTFHSRVVLATVDIINIDLIFFINNNYYRYIFDFSEKDNSKYTYKKNRILIKKDIILTNEQKINILKTIKTNKPNNWKGHYGNNYNYDNYYWIFKCKYKNGLDYCKSGNDELPENWVKFIEPFESIVKNEALKGIILEN